jgi:hypothetical protein
MEYSKPEVFLIGDAIETIRSTLAKNIKPVESIAGPFSASAAYQADE